MVKSGEQLEGNIYSIFKKMHGSNEYFASLRMDLKTMVQELGPHTWFVALSAAKYDWSAMSDVLIKLNSDVYGTQINAVSC